MQQIKLWLRWTRLLARARLAAAACFFVCPLVLAAASSTATNWLTLPELLKKWEPVPLTEIHRLAEGGDAIAQHYLGYCYTEGLRVPQDPAEGASWYRRALQAGYLPSANNLGLLYQCGLLGTNDFAKAIEYTRYAAERGLAQSQMNMGVFYRDGKGVRADPSEALRWFRLAASQGHPVAMVEIGRAYRFGHGVKMDLAEAARWFEKAIDQNSVNEGDSALARFNLGLLYEADGDARSALPYYRQAADEGQTYAMVQLYLCYWEGNGVEADHAKAMRWLKKSADAKNPYAECLMGYRCENVEWVGEGSERHLTRPDWQGALRWYRRSAEQGWAGGQYHLGLMYLDGKIVEMDEARGLELIRAAADQNQEAALRELANLYAQGVGEPRNASERPVALLERVGAWKDLQPRYEYGLGTERDLIMAARCFCKRLLNDSYSSPYGLTNLIEYKPTTGGLWTGGSIQPRDGHVTIMGPMHRLNAAASDDLLRALSEYLKAAKGEGQSALQIGDRYLSGRDVPKSSSNAWVWYTIAAKRGASEAHAKIAQAESLMTEGELNDAQRLLPVRTEELKAVAPFLRESAVNSLPK